MRHLTPADYTVMPWANGRGQTVEMWRVNCDGALLWRLSRASVVEDGPFSVLPGIARNLTVISGPGFDLVGPGMRLRCDPLMPVAFDGGMAVAAAGVVSPSDDFNAMVGQGLRAPEVAVLRGDAVLPAGGTLCLFALGPVRVNGIAVGAQHLIITQTAAELAGDGPVIAVRIDV